MNIAIFGIQSLEKVVHGGVAYSQDNITLQFIFEHREHDCLIVIVVKHEGYSVSQKKNFIVSSKTGFEISGVDLSFLEHALNPKTIDLCVELTQTAIAHNRVLGLFKSEKEESINVANYISSKDLNEIVRDSLSATLN